MVVRHGKEGLKSGGKFKSNSCDLAILLDYMDSNNIVIEDEIAFYNFFTLTLQAEQAMIQFSGLTKKNRLSCTGLVFRRIFKRIS